ncbi:MAG: hypothetical protein C0504_02570 [Candidatus Solibacter sp.]|nr:hypothetical protein [Candidatus Solibacter sp.]
MTRSETPANPLAPAILEQGAKWLLHSGIQEPSGGVARYHFTDRHQNARISTEITGYFISSTLDLHSRLGDPRLLDAACRAARFLADSAWDADLAAMPFEWSAGEPLPEHASYFFDNGIIVRALLRLWRTTGETSFLICATACGDSMLHDFVNPADIHPILGLPSKQPAPREDRWSRQPGCYQLKSALAWHGLADATGDSSWLAHFDAALQRAISTHAAFPEAEPGPRVMDRLHAYCYFLEACLSRTADPAVAAALCDGIARAASLLRRVRPEFERADVPAQILRVRLWADAAGILALDESAAAEEASWAASHQMSGGAANIDGGFCFGRRSGSPAPFVNPVSTVFCLQALALWRDHIAGRALPSWHTLV